MTSDIVLPSVIDHWDVGEAYLDHAMPFDRIPAAPHVRVRQIDNRIRSDLQSSSQARVAQDEDFQKVQEAIRRYLERKSRKTMSLNEETLRKEREEDEQLADAMEELTKQEEGVDTPRTTQARNRRTRKRRIRSSKISTTTKSCRSLSTTSVSSESYGPFSGDSIRYSGLVGFQNGVSPTGMPWNTASFPRRRESIAQGWPCARWMPAFADMTGWERGDSLSGTVLRAVA